MQKNYLHSNIFTDSNNSFRINTKFLNKTNLIIN